MTYESDALGKLRGAVHVIEAQRRLLLDAGADAGVVEALGAILRHLAQMPDREAAALFRRGSAHGATRGRNAEEITQASRMTLEEVEAVVADEKATKAKLEMVAVGRFQVPRGSLRSIGSAAMLREKIATLARNERAHQTISTLAQDRKR